MVGDAERELVAMAEARGDFVAGEDGYVYYWPDNNGSISAWELRALADELDKRNALWDAELMIAMSKLL